MVFLQGGHERDEQRCAVLPALTLSLGAGEKLAPLNSSLQAASSEEPLKPCEGTAAALSVISRSEHRAQRPAGAEERHRER